MVFITFTAILFEAICGYSFYVKYGSGFPQQFKGTVSVISSDFPCIEGNARFTMVPLKALFDHV